LFYLTARLVLDATFDDLCPLAAALMKPSPLLGAFAPTVRASRERVTGQSTPESAKRRDDSARTIHFPARAA
jgi:hypothetical protein